MQTITANSIFMAPELLTAVECYAKDAHKNVDDVVEEALRFYVGCSPEANKERVKHKQRAAAMGLEIEEYMAYMIKEWRREDREAEGLRKTEGLNAARRP